MFTRTRNLKANKLTFGKRDPKKFESIHVIDLQLIYATCTTNRHIASVIIKRDGIGLRDYQPLSNMAVIGMKWVQCVPPVASSRSLTGVSIATLNVVCIISARGGECLMPHTVTPHGDGVVVSDPEKHCVLKCSRCEQNVQVFTGDGTPGNNDGLATKCRLFRPSGICSDFNNVVYVCDTQTNCIKIFTTLKKTAEFLRVLESCFMHFPTKKSTRHQTYESCDLSGAIVRVDRCLQVLEENVASIRELNCP